MASMNNYTGPNPNPSLIPNRNPNPETEVEETAPLAQKQFTGARYKNSGGYVAEIRHGDQRFWLGTFGTAYEAGLAYDMAAMRLRHRTYNFPVDGNGRIITAIDQAKQDQIEKQVDKKLGSNTRLGAQNTDHRAETSTKRKLAPKSGKTRKKREVAEEQRAKELEGFL